MNKEVNGIDLFKLIFAIGIVGIHTGVSKILPAPADYYVMKLWFRIGVPFFFIASGYFFGKKLDVNTPNDNVNKALTFCSRMLLPFIVWAGLRVIKTIIEDVQRSDWQSQIIIDIHKSIFYPPGGMWFVSSMFIAAIIIALLYRYEAVLIILSVVCYAFALLCNSYYFVVSGTAYQTLIDTYLEYFISARNGLFVGLLFFGTGVFIARREKDGFKLGSWAGYLVLALSLAAYVAEIVLLYGKESVDDNSLCITSAVLAGSLFIVTRNARMPYSQKASMVMRDLSKYIYFTHSFVMAYLSIVLLHLTNNAAIIFVHTLVLCVVIYLISRKFNIKLLKKIIA